MDIRELSPEAAIIAPPKRWLPVGPVVMLLFLSPVLAEVHFGAIRFTVLFALIPAIGAWGCGALLIREFVLIRGRGWDAVLLLGIALSIAEECIIQQTSLSPLVGLDPSTIYGRRFGVNWIYFLWAIGYETVWAVMIPIFLVEATFPSRRRSRWLGRRGIAISAVVFGLASFVAWYLWTQIMIPQLFPESKYEVPSFHFAVAVVGISALGAAGLANRPVLSTRGLKATSVPNRWAIGTIGLVLGLGWFGLVFLAYGALPGLPPLIPMLLGITLAVCALQLVTRWSLSPDWHEVKAISLSLGALTASMFAGFVVLKGGAAPFIDYAAKGLLNGFVIIWLCWTITKRDARKVSSE